MRPTFGRTVGFSTALIILTACGSSGGPAPVPVIPTARGTLPSTIKPPVTALTVLSTIPVKTLDPITGYTRAKFGVAWTDDNTDPLGHNKCDTRDDILHRDLADPVFKSGSTCTIISGTLADPYTQKVIKFKRGVTTSGAVQIDHIVSLGDAWQTGAQTLTTPQRVNLANDPLNLFAVDGPSNEAKGDGNAAAWLPPISEFWCFYVARQVVVKHKYGLWITISEKAAMTRVLAACPAQAAPTEADASVRVG